ncbi:hypothetical protein DZF91_21050 [Actinomadura logoneensis]|uniref:Lipoprotein n=1 Tax=Actinomadura logoneensis TaxID=2293572 RepID=A0A372JI77_9ACTN|nr:hypothetical protein [Actinomadura logoneensis]RFU39713.1 hypothetical protein DZF91_21050 [Actinomadura logoneensis]
MARRALASVAVALGAALTLSGCLGDSRSDGGADPVGPDTASPAASGPSASGSPSDPSSPTAAPAPTPAGWKTIGGPENQLALAVPPQWTPISLTPGDLEDGLSRLGLKDADQNALKQGLASLQARHAIYALDPKSVVDGYATNVNGLCQSAGGITPDALKSAIQSALSRGGATNVTTTDMPMAGQQGVRADYRLRTANGDLQGRQYEVIGSDRLCVVTVTARAGRLPSEADAIASTLRFT